MFASHSISRAPQPTVTGTPPPTLHESTAIRLISSSTTFLDTPFGMGVRSSPHNDSVVYLRKGECHISQHRTECILQHVDNILKFDTNHSDIQPLGAELDTGAQRGDTGTPAEISSGTGTTLNMQPAVGTTKEMTGILMGAETIDQHGKSFILVVPDVSLYDPGMSDRLISAGRLMEAGYNINFRIPGDALTDGFAMATGGSITTPDNLTVILMEYAGYT